MTDAPDTHRDPLQGLRAEMFRHTSYPGMDALVAVIPKDKETPAEVKQVEDDAGEGRWFPFEGGWKVVCPYTGQDFDPDLFHIEKDAWDHVHCDGCHASIDTGVSCWVAEMEDGHFVVCDTCYDRLKETNDPERSDRT